MDSQFICIVVTHCTTTPNLNWLNSKCNLQEFTNTQRFLSLLEHHNSCLNKLNRFVILLGDGGYPYAAQHLSLGAEVAKTASKYGENEQFNVRMSGWKIYCLVWAKFYFTTSFTVVGARRITDTYINKTKNEMNWEHAQHAKFALDVSSDQIVRENECSLLGLCVCMWGRRQTQCCTGAAAE